MVLVSPERNNLMSVTNFLFQGMKNDAEYETLIVGLRLAVEMKMKCLAVHCNSEQVVYQVIRNYQARGSRTESYMRYAQELIQQF